MALQEPCISLHIRQEMKNYSHVSEPNCVNHQGHYIEVEFRKALAQLSLEKSAQLVSGSPYDFGRRVYKAQGRVYKFVLRRFESTLRLRNQTLAGEYNILKTLIGCQGVPQEVEYREYEEVFVLSYKLLPGTPLKLNGCKPWVLGGVLWGLMNVLYSLSKRAICHNDIRAANILVGGAGGPYLIDFDQASRAPFTHALAGNFIGWNTMTKTHHSFLGLITKYLIEYIPLPIRKLYRKMRDSIPGRFMRLRAGRLKPLPEGASYRLRQMHAAWELAQRSKANSPNGFVCYYSLEFEGFHLPGERPWDERWSILSEASDVRNKRILELGCNLSLLSCYFLTKRSATAALCVDKDAGILAAAQKLAAAYGVAPTYCRVDFDAEEDWETELARFRPDVVTALSVLNWVKEKERFLSFLGRFNEVLFEGHESEETERKRLIQCGFKHVRLVATSERKRPVLHALK